MNTLNVKDDKKLELNIKDDMDILVHGFGETNDMISIEIAIDDVVINDKGQEVTKIIKIDNMYSIVNENNAFVFTIPEQTENTTLLVTLINLTNKKNNKLILTVNVEVETEQNIRPMLMMAQPFAFEDEPMEVAQKPINYLVIDEPTRIITIPPEESVFGTEYEKDAEEKYFKMPRYVDNNIDISTLNIQVVYQNAVQEIGKSIVQDVKVTSEEITFKWILPASAVGYKGVINFLVKAVKTDSQGTETIVWSTTVAQGTVLKGLNDGDIVLEPADRDTIAQFMQELENAKNQALEEIQIQGGISPEEKTQIRQSKNDIENLKEILVETNGQTITNTFNAFNPNTCIDGKYLDNNGVEKDGIAYSCSDYITVKGYNFVGFSGYKTTNLVVVYDYDKKRIASDSADNFNANGLPNDAWYVRFNFGLTSKPNVKLMLLKTKKCIDIEQVTGLGEKINGIGKTIIMVGNDKEYTSLKNAIDYAGTVASELNRVEIVLDKGEYNILSYFDLLKEPSSFTGLIVPNYVSLIGTGGIDETILYAELPVDISEYSFSRNDISTLNLWKNNCLKNLTIKAKNIRYAVHNDDYKGKSVENAIEIFENCHFVYEKLDNGITEPLSKIPFGAGAYNGRKTIFNKCVFETFEPTSRFSALFHNNTNSPKPCEWIFENCEFKGGSSASIKVSSAGSGQIERMIFKGCKGDKQILFTKERVYTGEHTEFKLYGYGNLFVRGYGYESVTPSSDNFETNMMI